MVAVAPDDVIDVQGTGDETLQEQESLGKLAPIVNDIPAAGADALEEVSENEHDADA